MESTLQNVILSHYAAYPEMELTDYVKLIYQNEFGCGHLISNLSDSELFLKSEYEMVLAQTTQQSHSLFIEAIGNGLCRIYLNPAEIAPDPVPLLNQLFAATAKSHQGSLPEFRKKTDILHEMAAQGLIPLKEEAVKCFLENYFSAGCPALHHSEAYRKKYHPHYRVIKLSYAFYYPVFQALQRLSESGRPVTIAIDGRCGSGKSMLANQLLEVFTCSLFHMDDFFLPFAMRTKERLSQPGGNVDYERFAKEVMDPLTKQQDVCFQPFDCGTGELRPPVCKPASSLSIIEGSYSLHPSLINRYDFRIFLTCSPEIQQQRILRRQGHGMLQRFIKEWIPLEENYFSACAIEEHCDLVLETTDFTVD